MLIDLLANVDSNQSLKVQYFQVPISKPLCYLSFCHSLQTLIISFLQDFCCLWSCYLAVWHYSTKTSTVFKHFHFTLLKNLLDILIVYLIESKSFFWSIPRKHLSLKLVVGSVDIESCIEGVEESFIVYFLVLGYFSDRKSDLNRWIFTYLWYCESSY